MNLSSILLKDKPVILSILFRRYRNVLTWMNKVSEVRSRSQFDKKEGLRVLRKV